MWVVHLTMKVFVWLQSILVMCSRNRCGTHHTCDILSVATPVLSVYLYLFALSLWSWTPKSNMCVDSNKDTFVETELVIHFKHFNCIKSFVLYQELHNFFSCMKLLPKSDDKFFILFGCANRSARYVYCSGCRIVGLQIHQTRD